MREISLRAKLLSLFGIVSFFGAIGAAYYVVYSPAKAERFRITAVFSESVNGLENGSFVLYLGVPVGKVISIDLKDDRVHVSIAFSGQFTLNQSSYLSLETPGMLERKLLHIYTPNLNDAPLLDPSDIKVKKAVSWQTTNQEVGNLTRRAQKLITELENALAQIDHKKTVAKINRTLEDADALVNEARATLRKLRRSRMLRWIGVK